jgi:glycosyltransferase involved in cell wall biosynthesis
VLHVTREHHADRRYGLGRSLMPLVEGLQRRGHEVRYLSQADRSAASQQRQQAWQRRFARYWVPLRSELSPLIGAFLERVEMGRLAACVAQQESFSHVHLHDPWMAWGYQFYAGRQAVKPWGVTEHGFGCYSQATLEDGLAQSPRLMRWLRALESRVLARASWVIAPTQAALLQLARDLALPELPQHWHVVPHARPALQLIDRAAARRLLGWDGSALYVLGVGRLVPLKRFSLLVDACAQLSMDVRLVLLGEGQYEALQAQASARGLRHPIEFACTADVGAYYSAADIYVSTSASESFGMANLEALTAGLPTLCTAVGGVPEVIGDGGWLVPGELGAVGAALESLSASAAWRARLAARGTARAASWPDIDAIVEKYEKIYVESARPVFAKQ